MAAAVPGGTGGWNEVPRASMETDRVFSSMVDRRESAQEDFDALVQAALEGVPESKRHHVAFLPPVRDEEAPEGERGVQVIRTDKLKPSQSSAILNRLMGESSTDNERFLKRLKQRMERVDIKMSRIHVRFEDLTVMARVYAGSRANPSLLNTVRNVIEDWVLTPLHLSNQRTAFPILRNVSGVLEPGRMCLLLGPPGAGKSTLLKALSGGLQRQKGLQITGDITYNGKTFNEFVVQRTAGYVQQVDVHTGELTVRETLNFAAQFQGVGQKYEQLAMLREREREQGIKSDPELDAFLTAAAVQGHKGAKHHVVTEYMLKLLGLDVAADTLIGNEMKRGVSGGQRKRVTIGEIVVGPSKTLFMDEISTGLDASTTYSLVRSTRNFVHHREGTVLMALLQPAPEVFEMFDDVMLLSEGVIVYHGPVGQVVPFFESMGFRLPERKGVADFLQEVTSKKDQEQYWAGNRPYPGYITVTQFAEAFQRTRIGQENAARLATPYQPEPGEPDGLVYEKYAMNGKQMLKTLAAQERILIKRNGFLYAFRTSQVLLVAFLVSTLFVKPTLSPTSITDGSFYLAVLFFSLIHMQFNGFSEMSLIISELPVFFKKRDALFYPAWVYGLPGVFLRLPYSVMEATIYSVITYWAVGLAPDAGRFFTFWLLMFLMHQMSVSLFRAIGAFARSQDVASTLGSLALLVVFLLGGFILAKDDIPVWWIWGFWVSPLSYAQNAVAVNEFTAPRWQNQFMPGTTTTLGDAVLSSRDLFLQRWWAWIGFAVLVGYAVIFNIATLVALTYFKNLGGGSQVVSEEDVAARTSGPAPRLTLHQAKTYDAAAQAPTDATQGHGIEGVTPALEHSSSEDARMHISPVGSPVTTPKKDETAIEMAPVRQVAMGKDSSSQHGMVLPFKPLAMAFRDINYFVPNPMHGSKEATGPVTKELQLLRDITGSFRPGVLTALVGSSGAGKTTLMDVLSGRKTVGRITGDIFVGGYPKDQDTFARISGYVEQEDVHTPQVTVRESLLFSARMRLHGISEEDRKTFVEEVLDLTELRGQADSLVGLPGRTGLSVEQRKRLTIGVELVANPSIVFMDEPTSGLDARAAAIVMRAVRNTVNTGRTVVCTIHQPSIDIFESFDELVLMKRGGRIIYFGPLGHESHDVIEYFSKVEGVEPIADGLNPATWMLNVTTPSVEAASGVDFGDLYANSDLAKRNAEMVEQLSKPGPGDELLRFEHRYARSFFEQFRVLLWKLNQVYWRSPTYNLVRFAMTILIALVSSSIFWQKGMDRGTQGGVFNVAGVLYAVVLFLGVQNTSTVQPVFAIERTVMYREQAAGMYSSLPFALAIGAVEIPYILLQTVIYSVITYSMIGFEWTGAKFGWYVLVMFLTLVYFSLYGICVIALTPSLQVGAILSSTFYSLWNLFAGFLLPRPAMPGWWLWYWYLNPVSWTLYGLIGSQLGDVQDTIQLEGNQGTVQVGQYVSDYFGYNYSFLGQTIAILVSFCLVFWLATAAGLKFLNYRKR